MPEASGAATTPVAGSQGAHRAARSAERSPPRTRARRCGARSALRPGARPPRESEVERCSAALGRARSQHVAERTAADEEREGLVLVGWPGAEEPAQHARQRSGHNRGSGPEERRRVHARAGTREWRAMTGELDQGLSLYDVQADSTASVLNLVPTYEYKCPNGHVFEVFKRIADPQPDTCPVCGASPGRDRALSRARAFPRLGFLLDRLRPRREEEGAAGEGIVARRPDRTRARATRRTDGPPRRRRPPRRVRLAELPVADHAARTVLTRSRAGRLGAARP